MKFRQGLIASATAAAVLTSGVTAANAEQTTPNTPAPTTTAAVSSLKDLDPREFKEWISVATAILALLGSIYTFADRYFLK